MGFWLASFTSFRADLINSLEPSYAGIVLTQRSIRHGHLYGTFLNSCDCRLLVYSLTHQRQPRTVTEGGACYARQAKCRLRRNLKACEKIPGASRSSFPSKSASS